MPDRFVGNGPFTLEEWRVNVRVRVKKSATYWDRDTVSLNAIVFHTIDSNDTEERAFRSGQLHVTDSIPVNRIDRYRREQPDLLRIDPYLGSYFFRVNVTRPPLNNRLVRRALAMAIDRQAIVEKVSGAAGSCQPAHSRRRTPPATRRRPQIPYDPEGARRLLAEAGFPEGRGLPPIEILFNSSENHKLTAEAIQQMWRKESERARRAREPGGEGLLRFAAADELPGRSARPGSAITTIRIRSSIFGSPAAATT